jgi:hypothetical protein
VHGALGTYGQPTLTSGTVQGFDVKNQGELYAKLPLGAASLSAHVDAGETLHLKYFVSGVATSTRDVLYRGETQKYPGCAKATHYVWAYNLGAFELNTTERNSAEAKAAVLSSTAGGDRSHEASSLAQGGSIASCSTEDQRACRVPIRLALRSLTDGTNPVDRGPSGGIPSAGDAPTAQMPVPAGHASHADYDASPAMQAAALVREAREKFEAGDGAGCLSLLRKALAIDARQGEHLGRQVAECTMKAGQCDEGSKALREVIASQDTNHNRTDANLDLEARTAANRLCPSATAKNASDFVIRSSSELLAAAKAGDGASCRQKFEAIDGRVDEADREFKAERAAHPHAPAAVVAWNSGTAALAAGATCVAKTSGCDEGLKYYKRYYAKMLRGMKSSDKVAEQSWQTMIKLGSLQCK